MSDSARSGHMLEGDGIVSNLYYYLWKKRMTSDTTGVGMDQHTTAELCIPSTVIFEHNFPKAWYYHTEQTKDIERKLGKDVDSLQILKEFTRTASRGSAAAGGKPALNDDDGDVVATYYSQHEDARGRPCTRVEFFDREKLDHFLLRRARRPDGFLQKWVLNTGKHNTVVQAIWSPHVCLVNKRQNCAPIREKTKPLYERAVTYEGPTHYSTEVFVAPHIKWQVKCVCEELVEHLAKTQRVAISRMVLYFKVDHASDIWLLYCSSLRVTDRSQLNLAPEYVRDARDEAKQESMTGRRIARLLKETFDEAGDDDGGDASIELISTNSPPRRRHNSPPSSPKHMINNNIRSPHQPVAHPATRPGIRRPTTTANARTRNPKEPIPKGAFGNAMEDMNWPKAPCMGSIGDIYSEYPNWSVRKQQTDEGRRFSGTEYTADGRREQYRTSGRGGGRRRRFDVQLEDGTIQKAYDTGEPQHKWRGLDSSGGGGPPAHTQSAKVIRPSKKKKSKAGGSQGAAAASMRSTLNGSSRQQAGVSMERDTSGGLSPFPSYNTSVLHTTTISDTQELAFPSTHLYPAPRDAKLLWRVLRLAVLCGYAVQRHHRVQLHDWARTMQYCVYSHFLSHRTPMMLQVPVVYGEMLTVLSRSQKIQLKDQAVEREAQRRKKAEEAAQKAADEELHFPQPSPLQQQPPSTPSVIATTTPPSGSNTDVKIPSPPPHPTPAPPVVPPSPPLPTTQLIPPPVVLSHPPHPLANQLSGTLVPETVEGDDGNHRSVADSGEGSDVRSSTQGASEGCVVVDPTEWLQTVGLEVIKSENSQMSSSSTLVLLGGGDDLIVTVRVQKVKCTFLELQNNIRALLGARLECPFVALWWYYVAHHWLLVRFTERVPTTASPMKATEVSSPLQKQSTSSRRGSHSSRRLSVTGGQKSGGGAPRDSSRTPRRRSSVLI